MTLSSFAYIGLHVSGQFGVYGKLHRDYRERPNVALSIPHGNYVFLNSKLLYPSLMSETQDVFNTFLKNWIRLLTTGDQYQSVVQNSLTATLRNKCICFPESLEGTLPNKTSSPSESDRFRQLVARHHQGCLLDILVLGSLRPHYPVQSCSYTDLTLEKTWTPGD